MNELTSNLSDEEIAALDGRDKAIFALSEKVRAIREGRRKLKERRAFEPENRDFINAKRDELNLRKQAIIDRRDAVSEGRFFSAPNDAQVKAIRDAVNALSRFNSEAEIATRIADTTVDILEMAVGSNSMAGA